MIKAEPPLLMGSWLIDFRMGQVGVSSLQHLLVRNEVRKLLVHLHYCAAAWQQVQRF